MVFDIWSVRIAIASTSQTTESRYQLRSAGLIVSSAGCTASIGADCSCSFGASIEVSGEMVITYHGNEWGVPFNVTRI